VQRRLAGWRSVEATPAHLLPIGPRNLAWLLLRRPAELEEAEQSVLEHLCTLSHEVAVVHRLAQQFLVLVQERRGVELDGWATDARNTGPPELRGFARNLRRDWAAVQAGLTVEWSSGPVEGHVNRLKLIKRQMFGRAKFDLLRRRVLLAS
jgi:transposase